MMGSVVFLICLFARILTDSAFIPIFLSGFKTINHKPIILSSDYNANNHPGGLVGSNLIALSEEIIVQSFGQSLLGTQNSIWMYNVTKNQYKLLRGSSESNAGGNFGVPGVEHQDDYPGSRFECLGQRIQGGILFFAGMGYDNEGHSGILQDLWTFDITSMNFLWVKGNESRNQIGVYQDAFLEENIPGSRFSSVGVLVQENSLWVFGGKGYNSIKSEMSFYMNDVWILDVSTFNFKFIGGEKSGTGSLRINTGNGTDAPHGRKGCGAWKSGAHSVQIFGGEISPYVYTNDLWTFNISARTFTYLQGPLSGNSPGVYPNMESGMEENVYPGARECFIFTRFPESRDVLIMGGVGYASHADDLGMLNDMFILREIEASQFEFEFEFLGGSTRAVNNLGSFNGVDLDNRMSGRRAPGFARASNNALLVFGGFGYASDGSAVVGYLGDLLVFDNLTKCFDHLSVDEKVCSARGFCTESGCTCSDFRYTGNQCQFTSCFGIDSNSSASCAGNGNCVDYNQCDCFLPEYEGRDCGTFMCFGKYSNSSAVCNQRGKCRSIDMCECSKGYYGTECQEIDVVSRYSGLFNAFLVILIVVVVCLVVCSVVSVSFCLIGRYKKGRRRRRTQENYSYDGLNRDVTRDLEMGDKSESSSNSSSREKEDNSNTSSTSSDGSEEGKSTIIKMSSSEMMVEVDSLQKQVNLLKKENIELRTRLVKVEKKVGIHISHHVLNFKTRNKDKGKRTRRFSTPPEMNYNVSIPISERRKSSPAKAIKEMELMMKRPNSTSSIQTFKVMEEESSSNEEDGGEDEKEEEEEEEGDTTESDGEREGEKEEEDATTNTTTADDEGEE